MAEMPDVGFCTNMGISLIWTSPFSHTDWVSPSRGTVRPLFVIPHFHGTHHYSPLDSGPYQHIAFSLSLNRYERTME